MKSVLQNSSRLLLAVCGYFVFAASSAMAQQPLHVAIANRYLMTIDPVNNEYASPLDVWFDDGDLFAYTMCGSYAAHLHKTAYGAVDNSVFTGLFDSTSPNAEKWYNGLAAHNVFVNQDGQFETFTVPDVASIQSGDVLAAKYTSGAATGHVMVVDQMQLVGIEQLSPGKIPGLSEAVKWEVYVHDSTRTVHGSSDTRYEADLEGEHDEGIGLGLIAVYSHPETGEIVGWKWRADAWTMYQATDSEAPKFRPMVAGGITGPGLP